MNAGMIADALDDLERPLMALQAVEQLTHNPKPGDLSFELVERQAMAWLLTVIHLDFAAQIERARNLVAEEAS